MENIALSRILHDLKNELLAYHIRLENKENDITSVLKAKFEASKHLDSALKLCFSMQTLQKTLSEPEYTLIEIKKFIDNYISQTMVNLPSNISFVPPKTTGDYSFYCSRDYLYSIINNLIKNSVDALTEKRRRDYS
jgi:signal transduction histidine kinase